MRNRGGAGDQLGGSGVTVRRHIRRSIEDDLIQHGQQVLAALKRRLALTCRPRQAVTASSVSLSGFYWRISQADRIVRSRSLWDSALEVPDAPSDDWARDVAAGPFGYQLVRVYRSIRASEAAEPMTLVVGVNRSGLIDARNEFAGELAMFLVLLWATLSAAAWLQVRIGLSPLRSVEASVAGMKASPASRLDAEAFPAEVSPLVDQINTLAETREGDLHAARDRAANLAHALKTPLAALSALARKARASGDADLADGFEASIRAASATVERELARARTAASVERGPCEAGPVLSRLAEVLRRTERGARLRISVEAGQGAMLPVHADQLFEMAGPLMENAVRYAKAEVRVTAAARELAIEDDGPGLGQEDREQVVLRGQRADERPGGHGLGLSIAHDLAEATGGQLELQTSPLGGLLARVRW